MARFRPSVPAEQAVAAVHDQAQDGEADPDPQAGLAAWLAVQRIGHLQLASPEPVLIDVDEAGVLVDLDKHPLVRAALDASGLGTALSPARLDGGLIRLAGPVGRPITQAVSAAVHDWWAEVDGLAYWSRLDGTERCWALFDRAPVVIESTETLDPFRADHRSAVGEVASRFEIALPAAWA